MSKHYDTRPSSLIGVYGEYPAYCFDEACAFLIEALSNNKDLHFDTEEQVIRNHYNNPLEFYEHLGVSI